MISNEKQIVSNLENTLVPVDYGEDVLNSLFKSLDKETKDKITFYPNVEVQKSILRNMRDPEVNRYYDSLNEKNKKAFDNMKIRDKYYFLKKQVDLNKQKQEIEINPLLVDKNPVDSVRDRILLNEPKQQNIEANANTNANQFPKKLENNSSFASFKGAPAPEELFRREEDYNEPIKKDSTSPQERFSKLIQTYYDSKPFSMNLNSIPELEVKFGTRKVKSLTKNDYDNVIKKLKSFGFKTTNSVGDYFLRINCEFLDNASGRFKMSDIRTQISGLHNIQGYCKNNDIKEIIKSQFSCVSFLSKKPVFINKQKVFPVNFDDFNFRVSYVNEDNVKDGIKNFIIDNWKKSKKEFRFINRVTFKNDKYPFSVDISIVKYSTRGADKFGRLNHGNMVPVYTVEESNVFSNEEVYELEIEINNNEIGPATEFNRPDLILESLRKVIKYVLGGLQGTNYPISYPEQTGVLEGYMKMIWKESYEPNKRINGSSFVGPNSITLQMVNIAPMDENTTHTNVTKNFVVTDKADGARHLMYINKDGKIYLINTNMDVIFTGSKTTNEQCFNTLIDGELILHDKKGKFINLYAAFDIYFTNNEDVRNYTFMLLDEEMDIHKSRYYLLKKIVGLLKPTSIVEEKPNAKGHLVKDLLEKFKKGLNTSSPIRISCKEFYPLSKTQTIFAACNQILTKGRENRFEYETDGLIFTHAYYGVGSNVIKKAGPKTKITWDQSFKWKPPKYNTIDFLVTTIKGSNGEDDVKSIFEDGISANLPTQFTEYKMIELRCGFNEKIDGYINPCQDIIDDNLPQFVQRYEEKQSNDYIPKIFTPTSPYMSNAGFCKIMLRIDENGVRQMFSEENEVFIDNTIVEFSYNFDKEEGWRWVPLRVRHDKTSEYRRGQKQYGNSYKTANENWKSIHNPVTEEMICTGANIPDINVEEDIYYNKPAGKMKTEALKNFHNLYVKKLLITSISKPGDTLIDYACGKAGDLSKWIQSKISFVFGIDYSNDNLTNRLDGACTRFLNSKKTNKTMPYALFVHGNSSYNIKNGSAMLNDKAKQITQSVFGIGSKESDKIGKGVSRQYGVAEGGFNISSCQFALHYFLESPDTLQGFMRNLAECTKLNGYFIGTAYDGKIIFNMLKKTKTHDSIQLLDDGKKIWEVIKDYGSDNFEDDSSSIGYKIGVFQESINQTITEYLINFDYLDRVMESYGFKIIGREEAHDFGLPDGSGLFSGLFMNMLEEVKKNKFKEKDYGNAVNMTSYDKKISFLNRYFVYKKIREVNSEKVELEMGEYTQEESNKNALESKKAVEVAEDEVSHLKPKIRKLKKKLLLVAATEAVEDLNEVDVEGQTQAQPQENIVVEKPKKERKKRTTKQPTKLAFLIEDKEEE